MSGWRAYAGAYVCGLIVAVTVFYLAVFVILTSGSIASPAGLAIWIVFCPIMAAVLAFGWVYGALAGARFGPAAWAGSVAFSGAMTITAVVLIVTDTLEGPFAALVLAVALFFGGRYLMARSAHA